MYRKLVLCICVVLFPAIMATAQDMDKESEAK
jgi:hypothetical protein